MAKLAESEERKLRRLAEDVDYVDDEQFMKDFDKKVDEVSEDKIEEFKPDYSVKVNCEDCEYYCPYCGECTFGE